MKAHICLGGPLDGKHATTHDFQGGPWTGKREVGRYEEHKEAYYQFNTAYHRSTVFVTASRKLNRKLEECHVVWIHRSLLQNALTPLQREKAEARRRWPRMPKPSRGARPEEGRGQCINCGRAPASHEDDITGNGPWCLDCMDANE